MIESWEELKYWQSGEWQVVQERLDDLEKSGQLYNPQRENLFAALDAVDPQEVKVVILGQDPYPDPKYATGFAFSIPSEFSEIQWPPTLKTILSEYHQDLGYPLPVSGNLEPWSYREKVLLWNSIPSCNSFKSMSHDWPEYYPLTEEILSTLSEKGIVFVLLGGVARRKNFSDILRSKDNCEVLELGHPSPRGNLSSKSPFTGSRVFTTINDRLGARGKIDWRL